MRRLFPVFFIVASTSAAFAQGSLMDLGKNALRQQMNGGSTSGSGSLGQSLSVSDIASGLKEALKTGTGKVTSQLGAKDGFNADPSIHIPLPATLQKVQSGLKMVGMSGLAD
ncbi:MAG: DUF4197 family protein, partial [Rhodospirillales bacterium]